ncbi:MAG: biotin/lipoyl-containing protein, partial [Solirubrobacteraceae bacterium]
MAVHTTIKVMLPAMGESVTEGTVLEWHKREGDVVQADEPLVDISTDKVDAEVSAPAAGTVVKIFFAEGDTVAVGAVLAEIATNGVGAAPEPPLAPAEPDPDPEPEPVAAAPAPKIAGEGNGGAPEAPAASDGRAA